jgi:hypothetical protein
MIKNVTPEQLSVEKAIQKIVLKVIDKNASKDEANKRIEKLLSSGVFTKTDINKYNYRRDHRNHIDFVKDIITYQKLEHQTFLFLVDKLVGAGIEGKWSFLGSDLDGEIMIANFSERGNSPAKPDYLLQIDDKKILIDSKNLALVQSFKIDNLKSYFKEGAYILVKSRGRYFLYYPHSIKLLLTKEKEAVRKNGKLVILVSPGGKDNSHFDLEELVKNKLVKEIKK